MITETSHPDRRELEQAIVGSMMLLPQAANYSMDHLSLAHFQCPEPKAIFHAICELIQKQTPVDVITVGECLARNGRFVDVRGALGLADLIDSPPDPTNARFYVDQLKRWNQLDRISMLGHSLLISGSSFEANVDEVAAKAIDTLESIRTGDEIQSTLITSEQAVAQLEALQSNKDKVIPTGISQLDEKLTGGGFKPSQLIVVGGRPSMGKSALKYQVALRTARQGIPVLFATLEMSAAEQAERGLLTIGKETFKLLPLVYTELTELSKLLKMIRYAHRSCGIRLACIDYLQIVDSPLNRNENRERQVANASRMLKNLASELKIPILLGSQLNRESEKRGRPCLADLRESGSIEQDADIVILINGEPEDCDRELIIAKQRNGAKAIIDVEFNTKSLMFEEPEPWTGKL